VPCEGGPVADLLSDWLAGLTNRIVVILSLLATLPAYNGQTQRFGAPFAFRISACLAKRKVEPITMQKDVRIVDTMLDCRPLKTASGNLRKGDSLTVALPHRGTFDHA
jgi:hypothetical protein